MNIYIEYVVIDNLVIDFVLLYLTAKLFKLHINKWRLVLSCLVGTICAITFPLIVANQIVTFCLKILLGILLVLIAFEKLNFKRLIISSIGFFVLTFGLGGAILGIFQMLNIDSKALMLSGYNLFLPLGVFIFVIFVFFIACVKIVKSIYTLKNKHKFIYTVKIENAGKFAKLQALYDSGNSLVDKESGAPVSVINLKTFEKLCPNVSIISLVNKSKNINLTDAKFISFGTLGSSQTDIFVFKADKLLVDTDGKKVEIKNPLLGVSIKRMNFNSNYDCILNSKILE